jgi:hypothetical protein
MPVGIVLIDRKSPGIAVFVVVKDDFFPDVGGADQSLSGRIPTQRKVIGGDATLLAASQDLRTPIESSDGKVLYFPWRFGDANIMMLATPQLN